MSPQPLLGPSTLATKEGGSPDLLAAAPSCLHLQGMEVGREPRGAETTAERQTETYIQRDRDTEGQRLRQKEDKGTRWSSRQTKSQEKEGNEAVKEKILMDNGQAQSPRGRVGRIESDRTEKGRCQGAERTIRETNRQRLTDERIVCTWQ